MQTEPISENRSTESLAVFQAFSKFLATESANVYLGRVAPLSVIFGAIVFALMLSSGLQDKRMGFWWLVVALFDIYIFRFLLKRESYQACSNAALGIIGVTLAWWWILIVGELMSPFLAVIMLSLLLLGFTALPLPTRQSIVLTCCVLIIGMLCLPYTGDGLMGALLLVLVAATTIKFMAERRLSFASRTTLNFLGPYCESSASASFVTLRLLALQLVALADSSRALMVYGVEKADVISNKEISPSQGDMVYVRGLVQKVKDKTDGVGVLLSSDLGDQFSLPLYDWFLEVPNKLFYVRFITVVEDSEQEVIIFVPLYWAAYLAGSERTYRALLGVSMVARISVSAARSRFVTSDMLLLTQRSVSEREEELNKLVHLVNNAAQDVSILCEDLRHEMQLQGGDGSGKMLSHVSGLEDTMRALALGVSDIKLLKELQYLRSSSTTEQVPLKALVKDLQLYGEYGVRRYGYEFTMEESLPENCTVKVISKDFLETSLRALLSSLYSQRRGKGTLLRISVRKEADEAIFEMLGSEMPCPEEAIQDIFSMSSRSSIEAQECIEQLRAVNNLAKLSGGKLQLDKAPEPFVIRAILSLPAGVISELRRLPKRFGTGQFVTRGWSLFVDDNPQVTVLYSRVAEALELPYKTAGSVEEAQTLVSKEGKPSLVVTDIQLGDGNGIELVRFLRQLFGENLPIIVVSGDTQTDVASKLGDLGGINRYLTKPVGRAKLLAEIQGILGKVT